MDADQLPNVTVIMPVRNEERFIERSAGAVLAQDYPAELMEILVIDGQSSDRTPALLKGMEAGHPGLHVLGNPLRIVPAAMNLGLDRARGQVIVRIDGHTALPPDYVRCCVRALAETGADCIGGVLTTSGETPTAQAIALAQASIFGVGDALFRTGAAGRREVDTVAFGAYRRQVFDHLRFDESMGCNEDDEFNYRLRAAGGRIWLDPAIRATYFARATWRSLWRQYFQYGLWKVRVMQKVPGSARWRHLAPPLFALAVVGGLPLAVAIAPLRPVYLAGLALYALVALAVSARIAARAGRRHLRRLPVAFATLHLAYGLGFWAGLARFGPPWKRVR